MQNLHADIADRFLEMHRIATRGEAAHASFAMIQSLAAPWIRILGPVNQKRATLNPYAKRLHRRFAMKLF